MSGTARRRLFAGAVILLGAAILLLRGVAPIPGLRLLRSMAEWLAPGFILWGCVAVVFPRAMFDPNWDISELEVGSSLDPVPILVFFSCILIGFAAMWSFGEL